MAFAILLSAQILLLQGNKNWLAGTQRFGGFRKKQTAVMKDFIFVP